MQYQPRLPLRRRCVRLRRTWGLKETPNSRTTASHIRDMGFLLSTVKLVEPSWDHHTIPCTRRQNTDLRSEPPIFPCVFRVSAVPTLAVNRRDARNREAVKSPIWVRLQFVSEAGITGLFQDMLSLYILFSGTLRVAPRIAPHSPSNSGGRGQDERATPAMIIGDWPLQSGSPRRVHRVFPSIPLTCVLPAEPAGHFGKSARLLVERRQRDFTDTVTCSNDPQPIVLALRDRHSGSSKRDKLARETTEKLHTLTKRTVIVINPCVPGTRHGGMPSLAVHRTRQSDHGRDIWRLNSVFPAFSFFWIRGPKRATRSANPA